MSNIDERDEGDQVEEPHKPFCPKCGSTDIRASQSHRTMDFLLSSFSLRPYRCRSCRKRFYLRKQGEHVVDVPEHDDDDADGANAEHTDTAGSKAKS